MLALLALVGALPVAAADAGAWGQEGHSIVAELAQRRLGAEATFEVARLLGGNHSLASTASWADDVRDERPETYNWHFVDIPLAEDRYAPERDCPPSAKGDCIVAELERLAKELCAPDDAVRREALRFAVHFVGDLHQPLHTMLEARGGNDIPVELRTAGDRVCRFGPCPMRPSRSNFHALWDTGLIRLTAWSWGAHVDLLEAGLRASPVDAGSDGPARWAEETHSRAQFVWRALPENHVVDDTYYRAVRPVLDRQLILAGLRLAQFLDHAWAACRR